MGIVPSELREGTTEVLGLYGNEDMGAAIARNYTGEWVEWTGREGSGVNMSRPMDAQSKGWRAHSPRRTGHERSRSPRRQPSNSITAHIRQSHHDTNTLGVRYNA